MITSATSQEGVSGNAGRSEAGGLPEGSKPQCAKRYRGYSRMAMRAPTLQPAPAISSPTRQLDSAKAVFGAEEVESKIHFIGGETLNVNLSAEMIEQQVNAQPSSSLCVLRDAIHGERDVRLNARSVTFIEELRSSRVY